MKKFAFACGLVLSLVSPAFAQRLPGTVTPERYTLWFAPDLANDSFRGRETIQVQVKTAGTAITLNAAEITFTEAKVTAAGRTQDARVSLDEKNETATLTVPQSIPAGAATIDITYTGILNDKLRGFYRSEANGRKYAVTQMEATDARRAFPSFDEPIYKAVFDISLMIDAGDTVISNGRQISDTPGPEAGKHTVRFAPTPKMSSYLVAMLVGDFVCREGASDGTTIRICSTPDKLAQTGFALEAAQQQLKFYNDFTGIKYPWGKLDIVGVPDFAAGAMENAGAITFRERLLLVEPGNSALGARKRVAEVIAHEIAHMWFGDLVTMKWWDDIWLNEGFATWMEKKPLAAWRPDWHEELDEAADTQGALGIDALRSTRPIRTKVDTPEEINEVFDGIAYEKTAGVLRMIEGFIGPENFRKAVGSYLQKYSFTNATGEDFWTEVTRVTGRPVNEIMSSYVTQPGAPVISVQTKCVGSSTEITLKQERFSGTGPAPNAADERWIVPVCFKANDGQPRCEVLNQRQRTITAPGCSNVFANAQGRGYYFTDYSPESVRALARDVKGLAPVERLSLLNDEWWMVRGGRHDVGVYLDLAAALSDDDTPVVAEAVAGRLQYAGTNLVKAEDRARYQEWLRGRFTPALDALGFPGSPDDPDDRQSRRATLLELVGIAGNDAALQRKAAELARGYIANPDSVPPTMASTLLRVAAANGDAALYDQYVAQTQKLAGQPEAYYRFFNALPAFTDPALAKRTLDFSISPAVRTQDTGTLIAGLMARRETQDMAWDFVKSHWSVLVDKLGVFQGLPTIVGSLGGFCSAEKAADIRQFFEKNPVPATARTLQQALERVEACAAFSSRQSAPLSNWLRTAR